LALIKLLLAPIRRILNFPLVQLAIAVIVIMFLEAGDRGSLRYDLFAAFDLLTDVSVRLCAQVFEVRSFTRSWLTTGIMIGYVYLAGLVILLLVKAAFRAVICEAARRNLFGIQSAVARERGIVAYRAWLPLEQIRPTHIAQQEWEEKYAWPADGRPPYPPFAQRFIRRIVGTAAGLLIIAVLLQAFTPFPVLTWLRRLVGL
jgi:hypothetical protein